MYSLEKRQRAVNLYLKYGRNAALTIRELGYPNLHVLVQWEKEYEKAGRLHEKPACHRGYSEDEKRRAGDGTAMNQHYEKLENRIEELYVNNSGANLSKAAYDSYIKAFRWCTD